MYAKRIHIYFLNIIWAKNSLSYDFQFHFTMISYFLLESLALVGGGIPLQSCLIGLFV